MYILGYWESRGIAQAIRLLLEYLEVEYKEKHYCQVEEWFEKDKKELNTNFPNLPYLIDGEVVVTESIVIPIYLIKKLKRYELLGQNSDGTFNQNEIIFLQLLTIIKDLRYDIYISTKQPSFRVEKHKLYNEKYDITLQKIIKQLNNKEFLLGSFTYVDIMFYDLLRYIEFIYPNMQLLPNYQKRIESIPQIKKYLETKENKTFILERMKDQFFI
ncbi:hypothetical protein ABPG74_002828 [Tetrahymena malaccensis]